MFVCSGIHELRASRFIEQFEFQNCFVCNWARLDRSKSFKSGVFLSVTPNIFKTSVRECVIFGWCSIWNYTLPSSPVISSRFLSFRNLLENSKFIIPDRGDLMIDLSFSSLPILLISDAHHRKAKFCQCTQITSALKFLSCNVQFHFLKYFFISTQLQDCTRPPTSSNRESIFHSSLPNT